MKRWTLRILLILLIVIVVAIVATQIVLWTDYPRTLVMRLVQQQLGLRVEAKTLSTGWFGTTTLRDVKVSLPLAEESFLSMPTMEVDHTALIPLLVTQKFQLDGIELHKPNLIVRRDASGRWNLQDVAELVAKATAGGTPVPGTKKKPPKLPRLRLTDGTVTVIEHNGAKAVIAPLTVTGDPEGPLVYKYDARVPDRLTAKGQVAPGENFKHEVELFAAPGDWLKLWMKDPPAPLMAKARWAGTIDDGRVIGRLTIDDAKYEKFAARGRVVVQAGRGTQAIINPQDLVITTSLPAVPEVQLASGALLINGSTIRAQQVRVAALGGSAQLDGSGDLAARAGEFNAQWLELPAPGKIQHAGNLKVKVETPFPGGPVVAATLNTRGTSPKGRWDGEIHASGRGRSWTDMSWDIRSQRLAWEATRSVLVENFTARITQRGDLVKLESVDWPGHQLSAEGQFNAADKRWLFRANGRGLPAAAMTATAATPLEFDIDTRGDDHRIDLNHFLLRAQELEVRMTGAYVKDLPKPIDLNFNITHAPRPPAGTDQPPVLGKFLAEGKIIGTREPLDLDIDGALRTRNLVVFGREYGDINGKLHGDVVGATGRVEVRELHMLGGEVQAVAVWPYTGADRLVDESEPLRATIVAENLKLKDLGDLLRAPLEGGEARGEWVIDIPVPKPRPSAIAMTGSFRATNVKVGSSGGGGGDEGFGADEVVGQTSLKHGVFRADPVTLTRADRDVKGTASVVVQTTLAEPQRPSILVNANTWPVRVSPTAMAAVTAQTNLSIDGRAKSATGPITARASFATTQRAIGEASIDGQMDGRALVLNHIVAEAIGGRAQGSGVINADDPNRSTLTIGWTGIAGERVADLIPKLNGLSGNYSGAIMLAPATAQRALEPMRLTIGITPERGRFRAMEVGPARLSAYLNLRPDFKLQRIVLDASPDEIRQSQKREQELDAQRTPLRDRPLGWNDLRIAGGRIRVWGRRGRHAPSDPSGELISTHLIADFSRLDIDQLVHALKPDADHMPGRLSGSMTIHGSASNLAQVLGQGNVDITESDLGNVDALAVLYNATRIGHSTTQPTGHGTLDVSLQASTLSLENIRYFNRGVQARASSIDISDVWRTPDSPIFGYIFGSARPLKEVKLPLLADVDQILNAVQSGLTTVEIDGTVAHPKVRLVPFSEVNAAVKRFLVGEVDSETRGK